jgi:hypothetical protein
MQALQTYWQAKHVDAKDSLTHDSGTNEATQAPQIKLHIAGTLPFITHTSPATSSTTTLLLGLIAPTPSEEEAETALRMALVNKGMAFSVLYGSHTKDQLQLALRVLRQKGLIATEVESQDPNHKIEPDRSTGNHHPSGIQQLPSATNGLPPDYAHRTPTWSCEACSDPECEYRLFSRFIHTK